LICIKLSVVLTQRMKARAFEARCMAANFAKLPGLLRWS
jgi:hypothetical protein